MIKKKPIYRSDYLDQIYHPAQYAKTITKLVAAIRKFKKNNPFDAIAFTGTSGAAAAYPLSLRLKIPLICVRKERSHSYLEVEGAYSMSKYIIVDDFISSGKTIDQIVLKINNAYKALAYKKPTPIGIVLYHSFGKNSDDKWKNIPVVKI